MLRLRFITYISFCLLLLAGCGKSEEKRDRAEVETERSEAISSARKAALRLSPENITDSIAMEKALVEVRVTEKQLRDEQENELADTYISTFLSTLDSVNPSLRRELH